MIVENRPRESRELFTELLALIVWNAPDVDLVRRAPQGAKDVHRRWNDHRFREARILQCLHEELVGLIDEVLRDGVRRERKVSCAAGHGGSQR